MNLFRRVVRFVFFLFGLAAGVVAGLAAFIAQRMIRPERQQLWLTPEDLGLPYEKIHFPAQDGLRLAGWFLPAANPDVRDRATVVMVHGWPWNRLGEAATDLVSNLSSASPVDLMRLALTLHREEYNVLMFDLRNHGESAAKPPVMFGLQEARDLLGALAYLKDRDDVNADKIGVVGFSVGANTLLYALPYTKDIKAGVAVQPTTPSVFAEGFASYLLGSLGKLVMPLAEMFYVAAGGIRLADYRPAAAAAGAGDTPVLFVQGEGDRWGNVADVEGMAASAPRGGRALVVEGMHRFDGYQHVLDHPGLVLDFFETNL